MFGWKATKQRAVIYRSYDNNQCLRYYTEDGKEVAYAWAEHQVCAGYARYEWDHNRWPISIGK